MYKLELKIDHVPKSLNIALRSNRHKNNKLHKQWDQLIYLKCARNLPPKPLKKAKISITRHFYRTLDYDGLVGSLKPVVDALVTAGVLIDDNWGVTGPWIVDQVFRPKKDGPLLEIFLEGTF
jgi:hypothetical protein